MAEELHERLTKLALVFDRCLPGWAKLNANTDQFKLCPNLVMFTPSAVEKCLGKDKYTVVFICEHSDFEI